MLNLPSRRHRDVRRKRRDAACRERGRALRGLFLFISLFHVHKTTTVGDKWRSVNIRMSE